MNAVVDWFNQYNKILVTLTNVTLVVLLSLSLANVALLILEELENTPATTLIQRRQRPTMVNPRKIMV